MNIDGLLMIRNLIEDQLHKSKTKERYQKIHLNSISESPFVRLQTITNDDTSKNWVEKNFLINPFSISSLIDLALDTYIPRESKLTTIYASDCTRYQRNR